MSIAIIINPISGGARPGAARARAQLALAVVDAHGDPAEVLLTEGVGHARELAKSAVRRGARLVLAWGGDGTINEVASALAFDDVPLGIVPAGSGNGLARELGVHRAARARDRRRAAGGAAADGRRRDRRPAVRQRRRHRLRRARRRQLRRASTRRGFVGYAGITMRALRSYVPQHYRVTTGGVETSAPRHPGDDRQLRAVRQQRAHRAGRAGRRRRARSGGRRGAIAVRDAVPHAAPLQRQRGAGARLHDPAHPRGRRSNRTSR